MTEMTVFVFSLSVWTKCGGKLAKLLPPTTKFKSNPSGKGQQTFSICKQHEPGRILKTKSILKYEGYVIDEVNT